MNIGSITGGSPSAAMIEEMKKKMFAKVDANSDGGIDKSEMTDFATKTGMDTSKVDQMFESADADGNGTIDKTEHSDMMDKIGEKMKDRLPPPPSTTDSTDPATSTAGTQDTLLKLMDHIRTQSAQSSGTENLKQFLNNLSQQTTAYTNTGAKETSSVPSLFSGIA